MDLYRTRVHAKLCVERRVWVETVRDNIIKKINKRAAKDGGAEYEEEGYDWLEDYSL